RTRYLDVTSCAQAISPLDAYSGLAFDTPAEALRLESSEDIGGITPFGLPDGRADLIGTKNGYLAYGNFTSCGQPWSYAQTNKALAVTPGGTFATAVDYDGDGIIDLRFGTTTAGIFTIIRRRTTDMFDWT